MVVEYPVPEIVFSGSSDTFLTLKNATLKFKRLRKEFPMRSNALRKKTSRHVTIGQEQMERQFTTCKETERHLIMLSMDQTTIKMSRNKCVLFALFVVKKMNRNKLKVYAPKARRDFIKAVTDRAAFYGLTKKKTEPVAMQGDVAIIGGNRFRRTWGRRGDGWRSGLQGKALSRSWRPSPIRGSTGSWPSGIWSCMGIWTMGTGFFCDPVNTLKIPQ